MMILVTGGCGYIGSHTVVELLKNNYEVIVIDNFSNSKRDVLDKIKTITNKDFKFYEGNVCDKNTLKTVFENNKIDGVIHFAGFKAVGESVEKPLMYYRNNLDSTLTLLEVMSDYNCKKIVFSSSATVYGEAKETRFVETMKKGIPSNPYGKTKNVIEDILEDLYTSDPTWSITMLRYFNPVGSHTSGLIGDDPSGIPNNLMPYILRVAIGELECLTIFGNDYDTPDGTCIRDYIHVVDLALGHIKALEQLFNLESGIKIYNLGSGRGISVTEIVTTFERVNNLKLNYKYGSRRKGDLPSICADPTLALKELGWKCEKTLDDMCRDAYNFIQKQRN
ncbi:MAG: UDP-glucose 4-epimerase GalE [Bacilli bacterium]|nr:UDP-glucose 4-epimerase GalE [Bacilli bacterium]